jgi:hypothetical protein
MVHSTEAGEMPAFVSIEMSRVTVEPGFAEPDESTKAVDCAMQQPQETASVETKIRSLRTKVDILF